ncbi:winged helix-turn-helix domain-containing protein [Streptomyces virginiae]|uniref:winged helix-turn-helix domain-containing protein n=1 Tax=Streptomyces virginiae TaxID=1961 RepID=UPI0036E0FEBD
MTLSGISQMLRRHGWSHQVPARRAAERDEAAVAGGVKEVWPRLEPPRRRSEPGSSSKTKAGFSMAPPTSRTWARRGTTPVIRVRGRSQRRFSIAALCCYKAGERSRLIYRPQTPHGSQERRPQELRLDRVPRPPHRSPPATRRTHRPHLGQLERPQGPSDAGPSSTHTTGSPSTICRPMHPTSTRGRHLVNPPPHQPGQHRLHRPGHLIRRLRHSLRQIQYRSDVLDGCLTGTGLTLTTPRLQGQ